MAEEQLNNNPNVTGQSPMYEKPMQQQAPLQPPEENPKPSDKKSRILVIIIISIIVILLAIFAIVFSFFNDDLEGAAVSPTPSATPTPSAEPAQGESDSSFYEDVTELTPGNTIADIEQDILSIDFQDNDSEFQDLEESTDQVN